MLCCNGNAAGDSGEGVFLEGRGGTQLSAAALEQFHWWADFSYISFLTQWPIYVVSLPPSRAAALQPV